MMSSGDSLFAMTCSHASHVGVLSEPAGAEHASAVDAVATGAAAGGLCSAATAAATVHNESATSYRSL